MNFFRRNIGGGGGGNVSNGGGSADNLVSGSNTMGKLQGVCMQNRFGSSHLASSSTDYASLSLDQNDNLARYNFFSSLDMNLFYWGIFIDIAKFALKLKIFIVSE